MMKLILKIFVLVLAPVLSYSGILPDGFIEEELATKLNPTDLAIADDGRIFIAEKDGTIKLWRDGKLLSTPFLKIDVDEANERGLQSIVLDPDFEDNGYIYLYYTQPITFINRVSRFTANGDRVNPASEMVLYEMDPTVASFHNGGGMAFLPDGSLLFTVGDGGAQWLSQWDDRTHGKAIRIWPDGSIPEDNPKKYAGGKYEAIVAKGFRNPFNVAVSDSGLVFINDVGSDKFEEINSLEFGFNYGWPYLEGFRQNQNVPSDYRDPIYAYDHDIGCAVVGGIFCADDNDHFPERYRGKYFFSDYCKGYIKVIDPVTGDSLEAFATDIDRPLRLIFDDEGRLYYFERAGLGGGSVNDNTSSSNGRLLRITYTGNGIPVISRDPRNTLVSVGEDARFSVSANGSRPLSYQWYLDGAEVIGADSNSLTLTDVQLPQSGSEVHCVVFNNEGRDTSDSAILSVTDNRRPKPQITLLSDSLYTAGEEITVTGKAIDPEEGELATDRLTWWIDFHHDLHTHPAQSPVSERTLSYMVPAVGEIDDNVWYRIYLRATDSAGLSRITYLDVYPKKINIIYTSEPDGLLLNVDGTTITTPDTIRSVAGIEHACVPVTFQVDNEYAYTFKNWSNAGAGQTFIFRATEEFMAEALFAKHPLGNGTGLIGEYYNYFEKRRVFDGDPVMTRVDSIIDFKWKNSPNDSLLHQDSFLIAWTGSVEPIYDAMYSFGVDVRNGCRLYIDGDLVIDEWVSRSQSFYSSDSIHLQGGKKYSIRLEMFKSGGDGLISLYWSTDLMPLQLIPTTQLYTLNTSVDDSPGSINAYVYPNPVVDKLRLYHDLPGSSVADLSIYDLAGSLVHHRERQILRGISFLEIDMLNYLSGVYIIELRAEDDTVFRQKVLKL